MKKSSNYPNKKIAIMGGTFDPIHIGHLVIAQEAMEYKDLDKIIFIPAGVPPHKENVITTGQIRFDMVKLAIKDNDKFLASDYEINKRTKSYSLETVEYIKNLYNLNELYFIMGEDSLLSIETWYRYEEFLENTKVLVVERSYEKREILDRQIIKYNSKNYSIEKIPVNYLNISSTNIRKSIKENKNPKYYLRGEVFNYIRREGLYV